MRLRVVDPLGGRACQARPFRGSAAAHPPARHLAANYERALQASVQASSAEQLLDQLWMAQGMEDEQQRRWMSRSAGGCHASAGGFPARGSAAAGQGPAEPYPASARVLGGSGRSPEDGLLSSLGAHSGSQSRMTLCGLCGLGGDPVAAELLVHYILWQSSPRSNHPMGCAAQGCLRELPLECFDPGLDSGGGGGRTPPPLPSPLQLMHALFGFSCTAFIG